MFKPTNPEMLAHRERAKTYFSLQPDGSNLTWVDIEKGSGVPCGKSTGFGRGLIRTVLKRMRRPYITVHNTGIILSSPDNAEECTAGPKHRVHVAIKRVGKVTEQLITKHGEDMTAVTRDKLTRDHALIATLTMQAKLLK
jgi:hypothetical protein